MADQDAQDINQMMSATSDVAVSKPRGSKFLWIVLSCVVVGVGLGVVVYQQSVKPAPVVKTTPKPTTTVAVTPTPEAPIPGAVDVITPASNTVSFPKAGELRIYSSIGGVKVDVTVAGKTTSVTIPAGNPTKPMKIFDTGIKLTAASSVKIVSYLVADLVHPSRGWMVPTAANKCGANGAAVVDITPAITYATSQAGSEPIVSKQCWADYDPPNNNGVTQPADFNDYWLIWSYKPTATASASPSSSPSPSSSAAASTASSPSPSPSVAASSSPAGGTALISPTPSARAAMPDTSGGTPVTGVFEVTVGTVSVGLILLVLGFVGLLAL